MLKTIPNIVKKIKGGKHLPKIPKLSSLEKIDKKIIIGKKQWKIFAGDLVEVTAG